MQAVTSITVPSAVVPLRSRIAELFLGDVGQAEQTRLEGFKAIVSTSSQEDVKEAIRLKQKGETVAPFVDSLMGYGMLESSAKNRHSNIRVLFQAYMQGWNLQAATMFPKAVEDARIYIKGRQEDAKEKAEDDAKGAIIAKHVKLQGRTVEALEAADKEYSVIVAEKAEEKRLEKVVKAAEDAEVVIVISKDVPGIVQDLIDQYGKDFALEIAVALATACTENVQEEEKQAA